MQGTGTVGIDIVVSIICGKLFENFGSVCYSRSCLGLFTPEGSQIIQILTCYIDLYFIKENKQGSRKCL